MPKSNLPRPSASQHGATEPVVARDPMAPVSSADPRLRDRAAEAVAARRREIEQGLTELVTPELVAEHRRQPTGRHSPALAWLLAYFRQAPVTGKLVVHARRPNSGDSAPFALLRLSGRPGLPHELLGIERFVREDEVLHAAFLQRLADYALVVQGTTAESPKGDADGD